MNTVVFSGVPLVPVPSGPCAEAASGSGSSGSGSPGAHCALLKRLFISNWAHGAGSKSSTSQRSPEDSVGPPATDLPQTCYRPSTDLLQTCHRPPTEVSSNTHHELVFRAMHAELLQPDAQVVDADASIPVHVQDLEQPLQPVLLLGASA
ncbi:hypothetical protein EYF80_060721 [Liparis tanakae]|uniref:Uncharacterized protein n=1 Tax=Liparis tanakae TaxID=230148 RepID=A0A4Z2EKM8_9TELE|nr:hypothetical protein EYF80_060721 [Liparis tanakae]